MHSEVVKITGRMLISLGNPLADRYRFIRVTDTVSADQHHDAVASNVCSEKGSPRVNKPQVSAFRADYPSAKATVSDEDSGRIFLTTTFEADRRH